MFWGDRIQLRNCLWLVVTKEAGDPELGGLSQELKEMKQISARTGAARASSFFHSPPRERGVWGSLGSCSLSSARALSWRSNQWSLQERNQRPDSKPELV